jgi:hypothetical protein
MILFSATDIGGARAIIPVLPELEKISQPFSITDNGVLSEETPSYYQRAPQQLINDKNHFLAFLTRNKISLLVFGTAVKNRLPIYHCAWAKEINIPTVCLLDNWMNYKDRLELNNIGLVLPDHYFVMDKLAYQEALADGIPENILEITGHPGLASLAKEYRNFQKDANLNRLGFKTDQFLLVFVSEPASEDQGYDRSFPTYRGYTEFDVLTCLKPLLLDLKSDIELAVLPHPRDDKIKLRNYCNDLFSNQLSWRFLNIPAGREAVFLADGVIGMASILLYEAWLLQKPVISIQPNLRQEHLRYLEKRPGLHFSTQKSNLEVIFQLWWQEVVEGKFKESKLRDDLKLHLQAPQKVSRRLLELIS